MDAITSATIALVQDPFGNYVVQHVILMRSPDTSRIIDALRGKMFELSLQKFSSNVLEKCLLNSGDKDRNKIINEILNPPSCLPSEAVHALLFHQYGNYVFQQALEVAKDPQFSLLVEHSKQHIQEMCNVNAEAPQASGNLTSEHARRLAMRLVKKYPVLSGLEGADWSYDYGQYGFDYSNWGFGWDHFAYPPFAPPKGKGRSTRRSQGRRGSSQQTVRVGRIVGFWPNYTITYDEVPTSRGRSKSGKARGKVSKRE